MTPPESLVLRVTDADGMTELGRRIGSVLTPGDVICLSGPLGAGKTTLTRGVGIGLGVAEPVSSPTFVLARRHAGSRADLLHCDAYRVQDPDEFADLGLETESAVTVVEWGRPVMPTIADSWLDITIDRGRGESGETREVVIRPMGSDAGRSTWEALSREVGAAA